MTMLVSKAMRAFSERAQTEGVGDAMSWAWARFLAEMRRDAVAQISQLTSHIYLGPQYGQSGKRALAELGISATVNLRAEFDDEAEGLTLQYYCHLPTQDEEAPALEQLDEGVTFIRDCVAAGRKVYIHCAAGIGRAPTMAAAYFISAGLRPQQAIRFIRSARPVVRPTLAQMAQLLRWEERWLARQLTKGLNATG